MRGASGDALEASVEGAGHLRRVVHANVHRNDACIQTSPCRFSSHSNLISPSLCGLVLTDCTRIRLRLDVRTRPEVNELDRVRLEACLPSRVTTPKYPCFGAKGWRWLALFVRGKENDETERSTVPQLVHTVERAMDDGGRHGLARVEVRHLPAPTPRITTTLSRALHQPNPNPNPKALPTHRHTRPNSNS